MTEHAPIDSPGRLESELCYLTDCAALWLIVKFISLYNEVLLYHRLKTLRNGIGNAISNAIESRVPSSFRMNLITFTWTFLE